MILKASERGGARQLALHLLNAKDNEHVDLSRFSTAPGSHLSGYLFESQGAFPS
jgi:hypothetical protein